MPASGVSRAEKIREERRESLRELLRSQGHERYVVENIKKLENLDQELDSIQVQRIGKAIDSRMKLIDKFLPTPKEATNVNLGNQDGNEFRIQWKS